MSITFIVQTDGRPYLAEAVASYQKSVTGTIERWVMIDDSGDATHRSALRHAYPDWQIIWPAEQRVGYTPMRQHMWRWLAEHCDTSHVASFEDDFVFGYQDEPRGPVRPLDEPVNLDDLAACLDAHQYLAQMAFLRSEYYSREIEARNMGRVLSKNPFTYRDRSDRYGYRWTQHKHYFTANPHVHRTELCHRGWPDGQHTETVLTNQLLADGKRFAHWGWIDDPRILHHIGHHRAGFGY